MKITGIRNLTASILLAGGAILAAGQLDGTSRTLAGPVPPNSCASTLQDLKAWALSGRLHVVNFALATNRGDNMLVSYATGSLKYHQLRTVPPHQYLAGDGTQYFSDRFTHVGAGFGVAQPFSALATDQIGVSVDIATGATVLTLHSWGNAQYFVSPVQCANGVLYGFSSPGRPTLVTLSFGKGSLPPPPK